MEDPVIRYLRERERPADTTLGEAKLLDRRMILLTARAIVATLLSEGADALEFGRALLQVCFRRDGVRLGESLCNAMFDRAVAEVSRAVEDGSHHRLMKLSTSYETFREQGVPRRVCDEGLKNADSPSERARLLVSDSVEREAEDWLVMGEAALAEYATNCFFDSLANRWFVRTDFGVWTGPFTPDAFKTLLTQRTLQSAADQTAFIATCREFRRTDILPEVEQDVVRVNGIGVRNLFQATDVEPAPGGFPDIAATFKNVSNGDAGFLDYFFDWLALILQSLYPNLSERRRGWNAGEQARAIQTQVAIVLAGVHGAGKDTVGAIIAALVGKAHSYVLDQTGLDSRFRGQLRHALFLYCNEAMSSTNRSAETANFLKSVIAGDKLVLEEKYKTTETVVARMNVVIASNDDCPVIIEKTDRRYSVKRSARKLPLEVGARVWADLRGDRSQLSAFFDFLLNRRTRIRPGQLYLTPEREVMQQTMAHSEEKFVQAIIEEGWLAVSMPWVDAAPNGKIREAVAPSANTLVPAFVLNEVYQHWCREHGLKARGSTKLGQALKTIPGVRPTSTNIQRTKMRCYAGIPLVWPVAVHVAPPPPPTGASPGAPSQVPTNAAVPATAALKNVAWVPAGPPASSAGSASALIKGSGK